MTPDAPQARAHRVSLVVAAILLVGVASRTHFWHAIALAIAVVYLMLVIPHWRLASHAAVGLFLVAPVAAVIPLVGGPYLVYAAIALVSVGIVGATARRSLTHLPILAFLLWQLSGAIKTYSTLGGVSEYYVLVVPGAMLGLYLVLQVGGARVPETLVGGLMVLSAVEAAVGLCQTLFGVPVFEAIGSPTYVEARNYFGYFLPGVSTVARLATGTFEHFNGLGALLGVGTTMCFWYWIRRRSLPRLALLLLVGSGLIATFSRGSLIGALTGCTFVYAFTAKRGWRLARAVGAGAVALTGLALAWSEITTYTTSTSNLASRQEVWAFALADYGSDPVVVLFGHGFGYFQVLLSSAGAATARLHSAPLQLLLEGGIVGVVLFMAAVAYAFRRASEWPGLSLPSAGGVVALLVSSLFDNSLAGHLGVLGIGLLVVMASATAQEPSEQAAEGESAARPEALTAGERTP